MIFKGYGIVWNPKTNRALVDFKNTPEYETNDPYEIDLLKRIDYIEFEGEEPEYVNGGSEESKMSKNDIMKALDEAGIKYNPRDKKDVLAALLEG